MSNKSRILSLTFLVIPMMLFAQKWESPKWMNFSYPKIDFENKAKGTEGWNIYNRIVPNPEEFIQQHALEVVKTLYWSSEDSIPNVETIKYTLEDVDGISAKGGQPPVVNIF
ncbi:MAG: basic secretory protein-like protein, partial [Bacteroides sp.]|nr:basic secretory protein-like protein [Bacteroides sp.]